LVTGSSGWLGQTLVPCLRADGYRVVGLDPVPSATTDITGSVADRDTVVRAMEGIEAVIRGGALHKPHIETHSPSDCIATNAARSFERRGFACGTGFAERLAELG
jgi:UDP-glucose 4-epimerase